MPEDLTDIRGRIHRKSHEYFTLAYGRREKSNWRMFYGATDALLDASMAAGAFNRAVKSDPAIDLLVCYGFLQALYIQQDSVWTLSRSLGLKWHPNDDPRLKEIRDIRNRLTGHPALAGENTKRKRLSSAIISYDDVKPSEFRGYIYFEDGGEQLVVHVASVLEDNEVQLSLQMREIEKKMDREEREFRAKQATKPLSSQFEQGFNYLVRRLHCDLNDDDRRPQAQTHVVMIRDRLMTLEKDLNDRGFASSATSYHLDRILTGLGILERIMQQDDHSETNQHEFDLVFVGVEKHLQNLQSLVRELDAELKTPIA